jgi:hypothetical protein
MMKTKHYFSLGLDYYEIMDLTPTNLLDFLKLSSREEIINWLQWSDPNGVYLDSLSIAEFGTTVSKKEGIDIIMRQIVDN